MLSLYEYFRRNFADNSEKNWGRMNGYLADASLPARDRYKALLDYFRIKY